MSRRQSSTAGDAQARRLREWVAERVKTETGVTPPANQSLDMMVRHAAKAGITLYLYSLKMKEAP